MLAGHVLKHGLVWSGLVSFYWSGLYGLFIGLVSIFSLFQYFFFIINIIIHNVTYWCCLFYNSHSDDLYQYFVCVLFMI